MNTTHTKNLANMYARWTVGSTTLLVIGDATTEDGYAARAAAQLRLRDGEGLIHAGRYQGTGVCYNVVSVADAEQHLARVAELNARHEGNN